VKFTREQIDLICPKHERTRTSCNDQRLANCFYNTKDSRLPRCTRCYLLDCLEMDYFPDIIEIVPSVQLRFISTSKCEICGCIGGH